MIKIVKFQVSDKELSEKAFDIRNKVFVQEQNVDPSLEYENEEKCTHYLIIIDNKPVGTGRWRYTQKGIKLERFATLPKYRNRGLGTELLKRILSDVIPLSDKIYLHSQLKAVPYYERQGFRKKGDIFIEAGIKHYLMDFEKTNNIVINEKES